MNHRSLIAAVMASAGLAGPALAQLRVAEWNITNYSGGRASEFGTAIYGVVPNGLALAGKRMAPDVLVVQEMLSGSANTAFLNVLNTAPGSPGDWAAATFSDGPDTDNGFYYRTSKVQPISGTVVSPVIVSVGQVNTDGLPPRNAVRYDVRLVGYGSAEGATLSFYSCHAKAGSGSADQAKRQTEFNRIATNARSLPAARAVLFCADTNTQSSSQTAYQQLVNLNSIAGPFWDPINRPGSWENSGTFRYIHTQDPAAGQPMDSRHDQILISASLRDGAGMEYIGNSSSVNAFSNTWNDPNHSYRCWGNDGSGDGVDSSLNVSTNSMVGPVIAQALQTTAQSGGHLPVYLDLKVPARIGVSAATIDFGTVEVGAPASFVLTVSNTGDVAKWTQAGIANLRYTPTVSTGFSITGAGIQATETPGGGGNAHTVTMNTSTPGAKSGTVTITSDAPDAPTLTITLSGTVTNPPPPCPADLGTTGGTPTPDGILDNNDFVVFIDYFFANDQRADFGTTGGTPTPDGILDNNDFVVFIDRYFAGCG